MIVFVLNSVHNMEPCMQTMLDDLHILDKLDKQVLEVAQEILGGSTIGHNGPWITSVSGAAYYPVQHGRGVPVDPVIPVHIRKMMDDGTFSLQEYQKYDPCLGKLKNPCEDVGKLADGLSAHAKDIMSKQGKSMQEIRAAWKAKLSQKIWDYHRQLSITATLSSSVENK